MSQQPETLTSQAALDALARETDAEGRLRYPRLSRPCPLWRADPKQHKPFCLHCGGSGLVPLPLDTAAVGPLLASVEDAGYWYKLYTSGDEYGHPGHCVRIMRMDGALESPPLFGDTPEAALLSALAWADAQRKETP